MKNVKIMTVAALLATAGCAFAQETPIPGQCQPQQQQQPVVTDPTVDRKADFNSPTQSPNRQPNVPSEDTLIKSDQNSGAILRDSLTPSSDRKADRKNRKKNKRGTSESDDSTSTNRTDPAIKP